MVRLNAVMHAEGLNSASKGLIDNMT
jgi:hypothetical protein